MSDSSEAPPPVVAHANHPREAQGLRFRQSARGACVDRADEGPERSIFSNTSVKACRETAGAKDSTGNFKTTFPPDTGGSNGHPRWAVEAGRVGKH